MKPDTADVEAAIAAARETRARVRSLPSSDPQRRSDLTDALTALRECWTLDHRRYMKRAPHAERSTITADPVRKIARERAAEIERVRKALKPTPGTPYQRVKVERIDGKSFGGWINRKVPTFVANTRTQHEQLLRALGKGTPFRGMTELREEVTKLLEGSEKQEGLEEVRRHLNTTFLHYERQRPNTKSGRENLRRMRARVEVARADLSDLAAELRKSINRTQPLTDAELRAVGRDPRDRWPLQRVEQVLRDFVAEHCRVPTKRELAADPALPHYTTLRRLYGPQPLKQLDTILVTKVAM